MATCDFCGVRSPDGQQDGQQDGHPPLTWTTAVERGRVVSFCDRCSREHLRAMESKLDSEWW